MLRQPIVTVMGHVDHGKTSILDRIRGTAVTAKEAGGITQAIGASIVPLGTIEKICGPLLKATGIKLTIPGLLFIDTPGHAAFTNLRKRGGNLADIAILVIDCNEGLKPQTVESIEVLKSYKTPFVIAANKIDAIGGWDNVPGSLIVQLQSQSQSVAARLDTKMYEIVGAVFEKGLESERFDRVQDYTKQVAIVPVSAHTGAGIPELLMTISGLAQKFLEKNLHISLDSQGKGTILEVKDQKGLGKVMDVIIYDGTLSTGDTIVVGAMDGAITTRVKGLFEPAPLQEIREKKSNFKAIRSVHASTGIRILAPNIESVVAGMPLLVANSAVDEARKVVESSVQDVLIHTQENGIIIKADSLGSLEALSYLLKEHNIHIRKASIGPVTKKDLSDAESMAEKDPLSCVILGFNIPVPDVASEQVTIITHPVIYKLIEDYEKWLDEKRKSVQLAELEKLTKPCKIKLLKEYAFRQSNPAIIGVEVLEGTLYSNTTVMNMQGQIITTIKGLQENQEKVERAERGKRVAASFPKVTIGRQIHGDEILLSALSESEFMAYKEFRKFLGDEVKALLKEIAAVMREKNPVWGV